MGPFGAVSHTRLGPKCLLTVMAGASGYESGLHGVKSDLRQRITHPALHHLLPLAPQIATGEKSVEG